MCNRNRLDPNLNGTGIIQVVKLKQKFYYHLRLLISYCATSDKCSTSRAGKQKMFLVQFGTYPPVYWYSSCPIIAIIESQALGFWLSFICATSVESRTTGNKRYYKPIRLEFEFQKKIASICSKRSSRVFCCWLFLI